MTTPTTKAEGAGRLQLPPGAKVGIIAGGGKLPIDVANGLDELGHKPFILMVQGEALPESELGQFEHEVLSLENLGSLIGILKRRGTTHVVLAGEIKRRPRLGAMRFNLGLLAIVPLVISALARGDDGLLKVVVRGLEARGFTVVGAHQIVPNLTASEGALTRVAPSKADWMDIEAAHKAALAIGALDIGQGAVAIGGRAIALEGIEGTDGLLERVKDLRGHGRLAGKAGGVLVKCAKPEQELRVDLPSIGIQTVEGAYAAGLAGIAVEAGRSLILDSSAVISRADALGLFVVGLPTGEHS
ncbi:UDP-2,3-diacylglucosamine diphosphatase LpxI [Mesorhizobium sp. 1M-11]|uniref:LpxI family protein n=1 Tax=Mesorhizobium sp. 1M-11 TaxID=1529006 RepID=UPI0006C739BA|nr:UDP-2,3-diacylglucosamine diphosphatase LpxI [Mesorhizobium sp. 1M-11]